jgi:DNA-binding MarR family transcriptional regulator
MLTIWQTLAAADEALAPLNITASDRALIEFLAREPHAISLAELARKRSVSRQHIHQSLQRLPNPRWVAKAPDPKDARSVLLHLTAEGHALWKQIQKIDRAMLRRLSQHTQPWAVRSATTTLRALRAALEKGNEGSDD